MSATPQRTQRRNELRDTRRRRRSKEGLTPARAREIDTDRTLPPKHPSVKGSDIDDEFVTVSDGMFNRCLEYLRRNEMVQVLHSRLREHPGTPSVLSIEVLLLGMMLALYAKGTCLRADVCKMLVGLSAYQAYRIGLCDPEEGFTQFSYEAVQRQVKRIEDALGAGWKEDLRLPWNAERPDAPMHPSWIVKRKKKKKKKAKQALWNMERFAVVMMRHSIPYAARHAATVSGLDSTTIITWARLLDDRKEKAAQAELAKNPPDPVPKGQLPPVGTNGRHGRIRRTACPDALPAYKGGTPSESSGMHTGFDAHIVTLTRTGTWGGRAAYYKRGDKTPNYAVMVIVQPGLVEYVDTGLRLMELAHLVAPNLNEALADPGYTRAHRFARTLGDMGIHTVYTIDKKEAARVTTIQAGKKHGGEQLLMNCGTIFPSWLPKTQHAPPKKLKGKQRKAWLDNRYDRYGYVLVERLPNGAIRVMCPQCAGKIRTNHRTRNPKKTQRKNPPPYLHVNGPYEYCCGGVRTIQPDQLDRYQQIPVGTTAGHKSYNRRIPTEGTNSQLKDRHTLERGWCKALSIAATAVGTILLAVIRNLRIASKERRAEQLPDHHDEPDDTTEQQHTDAADIPANNRAPPF